MKGQSLTQSATLSLSLTHKHTHTHTLSFSYYSETKLISRYSLYERHTLTYALLQAHACTHTFSLSHTPTHSVPLYLLFPRHLHMNTRTYTHIRPYTLTHALTRTHTLGLVPPAESGHCKLRKIRIDFFLSIHSLPSETRTINLVQNVKTKKATDTFFLFRCFIQKLSSENLYIWSQVVPSLSFQIIALCCIEIDMKTS